VVAGWRGDLGRVVRNLLDNALGHAASRVAICLAVDGGRVVLDVDDDGPGVPLTDRAHVFERFRRLDVARDRRGHGTGLGLAIVDEVVRAHGGSVVVTDSPLGGARLRAELPLPPAPTAVEPLHDGGARDPRVVDSAEANDRSLAEPIRTTPVQSP